MKRLLILAALVASLLATAPLASDQSGCEIAHECFEDVAKWFPPGWPEDRMSLVAWNPATEQYEGIHAYGLAALCYNYGGYYYLDLGGEYWNAC